MAILPLLGANDCLLLECLLLPGELVFERSVVLILTEAVRGWPARPALRRGFLLLLLFVVSLDVVQLALTCHLLLGAEARVPPRGRQHLVVRQQLGLVLGG